jgi:hypothetical protein
MDYYHTHADGFCAGCFIDLALRKERSTPIYLPTGKYTRLTSGNWYTVIDYTGAAGHRSAGWPLTVAALFLPREVVDYGGRRGLF